MLEEVAAIRESRYIWKTKLCEEERGDSGGHVRYNMRGCHSRFTFYIKVIIRSTQGKLK